MSSEEVRLSTVINEIGYQALSKGFIQLLQAESPKVVVTEDDVAESIVLIIERAYETPELGDTIEQFIDTIGLVYPLFGWNVVYELIGELMKSQNIIDENGWLILLRGWQRALILMARKKKIMMIMEDQLSGSQAAAAAGSVAPPIAPTHRRMFPLTVLPTRPDNRLLTGLVGFLVAHDENQQSNLIVQLLLESSASTVLLEVAHNLFYNHSMFVSKHHQLTLGSFLHDRLQANSDETQIFLVKLGGFLSEKLSNVMTVYLAASQGRDPLENIDAKSTLILDAAKTVTYFEALHHVIQEDQNSHLTPLLSDSHILRHFERLRLMAIEVYRDEAVAAGLDRRSFIKQQNHPQQTSPPGHQIIPNHPPVHSLSGHQQSGANGTNRMPSCSPNHAQHHHQAQNQEQISVPDEDYYFGCFFRREITAAELVELMERLSNYPPHSREADLLARMLRNLFTECRHFTKYPLPELYKTAEFFGKLIRSEVLLKRAELQLLAIRCVMEALRKDYQSNIFKFGIISLQEFIGIAPRSPAFLVSLTKPPALREYYPALVKYAEDCLAVIPAKMHHAALVESQNLLQVIGSHNKLPSSLGVLSQEPAIAAAPTSFGNIASPLSVKNTITPPTSTDIKFQGFGLGQVENLMEDPEILKQIVFPPEKIRNRIAILFNTMVHTTIQSNAAEIVSILDQNKAWVSWLVYYIVKTRVSKEINNHEIYLKLIDHIMYPKIHDLLVHVTYDFINILLKYILAGREAVSYRTVLKNLGSWLGSLTIAKNKPIKSKSFDIKHLVYNGYESGYLVCIIPLVCAVLSHIQKSKVFKLPNPWTLSCLVCLGSLYTIPNLKQTICFEIEILLGSLSLDIQQFINHHPNIFQSIQQPPFNSPDFQPGPKPFQGQQPPGSTSTPPNLPTNPQQTSPTPIPPASSGNQLLNALGNSVVISRSLALFQKHPDLKVAVPIAVERSIRELVSVLSERAVILAVGTTLELVLKDFACEPDENLIKRGAQLMAASLGGSIVTVSGRTPLRTSIIQNLKDLIQSSSMSPANEAPDDFIDQTAQVIASDNLPIASLLIEQVVIEQAVQAVHEALIPHLNARRNPKNPKELSPDPMYFSSTVKYPQALPFPLRLPAKLTGAELQVYKDFSQFGPIKRIHELTGGSMVGNSNAGPNNTSGRQMPSAGPQQPMPTEGLNSSAESQQQCKHPLSSLPLPPAHLSPQKVLSLDASLTGIDTAVLTLKGGVKELAFHPVLSSQHNYRTKPLYPEGSLSNVAKPIEAASHALRTLAALPSNHEIFIQMERVIRFIQLCEQPVRKFQCNRSNVPRKSWHFLPPGVCFVAYTTPRLTESRISQIISSSKSNWRSVAFI